MERRSVPASVPSLKNRGKKTPQASEPAERLGNPDSSDSSDGHDKGAGKAEMPTQHKGPDRTK